MNEVKIIKASGEEEVFSRNKFCNSLKSAGAPDDMTKEVCDAIETGLSARATSSDIFREASDYLAKQNVGIAAMYNLKRGMQLLGPAGFVFEQFVETILQAFEYKTKRNQIIKGACVEHEVDIVAQKSDDHILIEAKYHNKKGIKTHVDDVMYADARFMDIVRRKEDYEGSTNYHSMWVVTNTKFTSKAIQYAKCREMHLIGWNFPMEDSLQDIIKRERLYPVTVLPSVGPSERTIFAQNGMLLARDLAPYSSDDLVKKFGITDEVAKTITKEAHSLVYGDK